MGEPPCTPLHLHFSSSLALLLLLLLLLTLLVYVFPLTLKLMRSWDLKALVLELDVIMPLVSLMPSPPLPLERDPTRDLKISPWKRKNKTKEQLVLESPNLMPFCRTFARSLDMKTMLVLLTNS